MMFGQKLSFLLLPLMLGGTLQANDPFGDDIFREMYQMQKEMDKLFERMHQRAQDRTQHFSNTPHASLSGTSALLEDKGGYYEYNTQIKENQDSQISVTIENGILHMKVSTDSSKKENQTQEHFVSMIQRSQSLPSDADAGTLKSEFKNGFLIITLQKKQQEVNTSAQPLPVPQTNNESKGKNSSQENNTTKITVPHTSSHA
ncbi:MAG: hypothetical protein B7X69_09280 [Sulfurovum sp. 39-42-12]|nr:MAG: hypothetical protein B7Y63_06475 [Sulfurovum sp. 35-42-20]OYZ26118.1 MAG: hypothetical protein B7Y23_02715 [Sulfurovum sp. 16-42-52]OYZ48274.1 MAG: hypothetical protein B7Y13_08145 [Sulfurovum sp. 24-42-9]OZA46156.1 MAG: hypothetical protein B7X80_03145 [Sulfurovum sp. 17-42-90]OZA59108.1 MAG: hypothetical protein B7X69_09280 [Sulfurovum sp. 39-42-12]